MRFVALGVAAALALSLTACGSDPNSISAQAQSGDRKGFVSGDGTVERIALDKREDAVRLKGTTVDGKPWRMDQARGKVLVVNVWGSWCGPCVSEAGDLQQAWSSYEKANKPVQFLGLDFKEGPDAGAAFLRSRGITYPSLAYDGGAPVLALRGKAPTVPTTLVLDTRGRIAARVLGPVQTSTLSGLVDDVLAEKA
ncbi:MAG: TlpA family protein disulfide reductase [Oryzihumus sp.]